MAGFAMSLEKYNWHLILSEYLKTVHPDKRYEALKIEPHVLRWIEDNVDSETWKRDSLIEYAFDAGFEMAYESGHKLGESPEFYIFCFQTMIRVCQHAVEHFA
jgi:hypothetical protein